MLGSSLLAGTSYASQDPVATGATDQPTTASKAGLPLYLEVFLGDRPTNLIAHLVLRDDKLLATPAELASLGLKVDPALVPGADGFLALDALTGLEYRYDVGQQRLYLSAPPALRPEQLLGYLMPVAVVATRGRGLLLNYDLYGQHDRSGSSLAVGSALRWFGPAGTLELTGVSRFAGGDSRLYRRLDTRWSYSDPKRLWTWVAGDLVSGSLLWSRSVRMGGLQWRRNFALRPDLIIFPMPRFAGQATLPSTVDLLVNNVQQFGSEIQGGPFVLNTFPRITGAGQATLVVRDELGRVTQTTVPIYQDVQRLAPGLTDFSVEVGMLRRSGGDGQSRYGELAASGSLRRGISDSVTLEAHAEASAGVRVGGLGIVWSPAHRWGLLTAAVATSAAENLRGSERSYGYQWHGPHFGLSVSALRSGRHFRDIGSFDADIAPVAGGKQDRALFWMPLPRGNLSASWLRYRQTDGSRDRIMTFSWSASFRSSFSFSANAFTDDVAGLGVGISFGYAFSPVLDSNLSFDHGREGNRSEVSLRQHSLSDRGWGWQVDAGENDGEFAQASANVRGRLGDAWFGANHRHGTTGYFVQGAGSVAWMAGHAFVSRRIHDAFAVVSSAGVPGVPVLFENRPSGVTNRNGMLLLPELRGWQRNRISIDPDALGGSYRLPELEQSFTPADGGGFRAEFKLVLVHPAVAVLLDAKGAPIPAGSKGSIDGDESPFLVGFDGQAYLENATGGMVLRVHLDETICAYRVPGVSPPPAGAPAQLGTLRPDGACQ